MLTRVMQACEARKLYWASGCDVSCFSDLLGCTAWTSIRYGRKLIVRQVRRGVFHIWLHKLAWYMCPVGCSACLQGKVLVWAVQISCTKDEADSAAAVDWCAVFQAP
jgi:hypothetical protein